MSDTVPNGFSYLYTVDDGGIAPPYIPDPPPEDPEHPGQPLYPPYEPPTPYITPTANGNLPDYVTPQYLSDEFDVSNLLFEYDLKFYLYNKVADYEIPVDIKTYYTKINHVLYDAFAEKPDPGITSQGTEVDYPIGHVLVYSISADISPPTESELGNIVTIYYPRADFEGNTETVETSYYIASSTNVMYEVNIVKEITEEPRDIWASAKVLSVSTDKSKKKKPVRIKW